MNCCHCVHYMIRTDFESFQKTPEMRYNQMNIFAIRVDVGSHKHNKIEQLDKLKSETFTCKIFLNRLYYIIINLLTYDETTRVCLKINERNEMKYHRCKDT